MSIPTVEFLWNWWLQENNGDEGLNMADGISKSLKQLYMQIMFEQNAHIDWFWL